MQAEWEMAVDIDEVTILAGGCEQLVALKNVSVEPLLIIFPLGSDHRQQNVLPRGAIIKSGIISLLNHRGNLKSGNLKSHSRPYIAFCKL
jgi:hypothetical protein